MMLTPDVSEVPIAKNEKKEMSPYKEITKREGFDVPGEDEVLVVMTEPEGGKVDGFMIQSKDKKVYFIPLKDGIPNYKNRDDAVELLVGGEYQIGAMKDMKNVNSFIVKSEYFSMNHLKLDMEEGKIFLEDKGSTNGTFIEGRPSKHYDVLGFLIEFDEKFDDKLDQSKALLRFFLENDLISEVMYQKRIDLGKEEVKQSKTRETAQKAMDKVRSKSNKKDQEKNDKKQLIEFYKKHDSKQGGLLKEAYHNQKVIQDILNKIKEKYF